MKRFLWEPFHHLCSPTVREFIRLGVKENEFLAARRAHKNDYKEMQSTDPHLFKFGQSARFSGNFSEYLGL